MMDSFGLKIEKTDGERYENLSTRSRTTA